MQSPIFGKELLMVRFAEIVLLLDLFFPATFPLTDGPVHVTQVDPSRFP